MNFKGVSQPDLYVVDFHQEDPGVEYPLSGPRGDFVVSLLGSYGLLGSTRFANMHEQGVDVVENDILSTSPRLIVGFGSNIISRYLETSRKITDVSGSLFDIKIRGQDFKLLVVISPSYVLQRIDDSSVSLKFSQDLYKAFQYLNGEYKDILKDKEILNAHSFEEFKEIYETRFKDNPELAYDIETNARPSMMKGSRIIGFSVANKKSGVYISIDSLDFHMSKDEEDQIWDFTINEVFEKKSKLIIHNTMYERPYTLYCKGYEIRFDKAHDTLVMARLLRSPKESAGLKYQAQKYLHYPDWETDLGIYISCIKDLVGRIGLGPQKYVNIYNELKNDWYQSIFDIISTEFYSEDKESCSSYWKLSQEDQEEIRTILEKLNSVLVDLYAEDEIYQLGILIKEKVIEAVERGGIEDSTIPYNWIPDRLLSKYGAVDSIATFDLKDYFFEVMDKESTDKVDLHKGYENWLEHMYVAYIMERNGMYWDDEIASKDRVFLVEQATRCLRAMLKSPCFEPFIESHCAYKYKPEIFSDYLPIIPQSQGFDVEYDKITGKYVVKVNGKRGRKDLINTIEILPAYRSQYIKILKDLFYEDVDKAKDYEELKEIYNPSSSTSSEIPRQILDTPNLQVGGRIIELHTLSTSPEFETIKDKLPPIDQKFLEIADWCCDAAKLKETYADQWASVRKQFYEGFCRLYENYRKQVTTPEIKAILCNKCPVVIESFDDGGIIEVYNNLLVTGIDQDDPQTWTPQFDWMVNFRLFKKSLKLISSYIDGSIGRQSVVVVDKKSLRNGNHCVERKRKYEENISDDEDYLLVAKWMPNTADTGRWRSAMHTVPWGAHVKKYYSSRFIGGTTCCPDYSQMEVRTLAAISKDKNMLELFHSGKDFHTETAKKIYRKDEVTAAERRFSKTATFSLLYGAMEESFARNYCNGDMDYAKMVYGGFFEAYPDVKKWVDERHKEVQKDHRVSLELSNRFITILPEGEGRGALNSMLRRAQNYPIQAQSADLTGCVIFDLQKYIEENNMKSLVFMYVHDSIEVDIYPYELFKFISYLKVLLNESPMRRMGLPSKADVALGKSLGHEIELEELNVSEDMTEGTMVLKGYKDEIDETVENWKKAYAVVEVSEESYKEEYVSMSELFILRKAYTPTLGTTRSKGTCKVHIKYYN